MTSFTHKDGYMTASGQIIVDLTTQAVSFVVPLPDAKALAGKHLVYAILVPTAEEGKGKTDVWFWEPISPDDEGHILPLLEMIDLWRSGKTTKGGAGSGNFGHAGIPGHQGGSAGDDGGHLFDLSKLSKRDRQRFESCDLTSGDIDEMYRIDGLEARFEIFPKPGGLFGLHADYYDSDGEIKAQVCFFFKKEGDGKKTAIASRINFFSIEDQGKGTGADLLSREFSVLRNRGFDSVELEADMVIGRYAWAKAGFQYKDPARAVRATKDFKKWCQVQGFELDKYPTFKTPQDVINFKVPGITVSHDSKYTHAFMPYEAKLGNYELGKAFMLSGEYVHANKGQGHGNWNGIFYLSGDAVKGGAGSGNFGHAGRPGERGGSAGTSPSLNVSSGMYPASPSGTVARTGDYEASDVEMTSIAKRSDDYFYWVDTSEAEDGISQASLDMWQEEIEKHPAWATDSIQQIKLLDGSGGNIVVNNKSLGIVAGTYCTFTSEITIFSQNSTSQTRRFIQEGVLDHEIGHSIYGHLTDMRNPMINGENNPAAFVQRDKARALKAEFDTAFDKHGDGITEYSRSVTKKTETFAEAYKIYHSGAKPGAAHPGVYSKRAGAEALKSHFKAYPHQEPLIKPFLDILEFCEQRGY